MNAFLSLTTFVALASGTAAGAPPLVPQDLEPFVDGLVEKDMAACKLPGAVVAVVKDGSPLFAKGYGLANLEDRVPVLPFLFFGCLALGSLGPLGPWVLTATPPWMRALFALPIAMAVPVGAMAALASKQWRAGAGSLSSRLGATSVALAGAGFLFFCAAWNVLGFKF